MINVEIDSIEISSKIFGDLKRRGITIGTSNLLIAGVAIHNKLELITNNTKHFKGIKNLSLENWKEKKKKNSA